MTWGGCPLCIGGCTRLRGGIQAGSRTPRTIIPTPRTKCSQLSGVLMGMTFHRGQRHGGDTIEVHSVASIHSQCLHRPGEQRGVHPLGPSPRTRRSVPPPAPPSGHRRGGGCPRCTDGPLLVGGPAELLDGQGKLMPRHRNTVALCRCGRSAIAPYCDGTHRKRRGTGGSARLGRACRRA